jgi:DnaK suppressor protein
LPIFGPAASTAPPFSSPDNLLVEKLMNTQHALDPAYIELKRAELLALRAQLQKAATVEDDVTGGLQKESTERAHEYEDDAQKLDMLETSRNLLRHDIARLAQINRALRKIEEGTYGYSDISGERISTARLNALPEATSTLLEQQARE